MAKVITCNKCGKTFDFLDTQENFSIRRRMGYGTMYDGDDLELDLCRDCMQELIQNCAVSPLVPVVYQEGDEW